MDFVVIVIILLIAAINAIARHRKDRQRKEPGGGGERAPGLFEQIFGEPVERLRSGPEENVYEAPPELIERLRRQQEAALREAPAEPEARPYETSPARVEKAAAAARSAGKPEIAEAVERFAALPSKMVEPLARAVLRGPALRAAVTVQRAPRSPDRISVDRESLRRGIILAELLGPPVAMRRPRGLSKRLF